MSSQKNVRDESSGERSKQQLALTIIERFNDPFLSSTTAEYRSLIFRATHDAYMNRENSTVGEDELLLMYHFWCILDQIDELMKLPSTKTP